MSKRKINIYYALALFLAAALSAREEVIPGRSTGPAFLYRIEVPESWVRETIEIVEDTQKPIAEFRAGDVRVTIHNFPSMRIPPGAQVERWKKQTPPLAIESQAFSGFQGLFFDSETTLAWALEWGASRRTNEEGCADVTFKATGPVQASRAEIIRAARSFERIEAPCEW